MADEKSATPLSVKEGDLIPVPAVATLQRSSNRRGTNRRARWIFVLLLLCAAYVSNTGFASYRTRVRFNVMKKSSARLSGKKAEKLFLSVPDTTRAIAASRQYATKPHMAGTDGDFDTAQLFLSLLQEELGIESSSSYPLFSAGTEESRNATLSIPTLTAPRAWIDTYYPVMNTPLDRSLEIIGDDGEVAWQAELEEVADETDEEAHKYAEAVPTFHGLSVSGDVQGKLVYAHYGRHQDYEALTAEGVDLNGTIVIVRYGGIFRGLKVKGAQELGAVGVLIYSDPRDDGTVTTENGYLPYPHGPARNPTSVQRGSVSFISDYPGDPTTPGYPAYENSTRVEGGNYPSIPSLPISWKNAKVLLDEIAEGGANREVKLVNHVDDRVIPIWNVMGVIPGHVRNEIVLIGNHRDAWVMGATDPSSGTVAVHEVIRGFGALLKEGWQPLRTIVIASWDAEEYALIGSTEWGEDFADFIKEHVVTYLNLDSGSTGSRFGASASPSLSHLYKSVAEEIPHPLAEHRTLWDATADQGTLSGNGTVIDAEVLEMAQAEIQAADSLGVSALGSGSDYTVFLQHIGIASSDGGFKSTLHDPVYHYHSVYDSERWQELFGDPTFVKHVAVAKHLGLMALRLSGSIILPLNTTHYAYELEGYLDKIEAVGASLSLLPDLSGLRVSIHSLQNVSVALDEEKIEAEHALRAALLKWKIGREIEKAKHRLRKLLCKIKKRLGLKCEDDQKKARCRSRKFEEKQLALALATYADESFNPNKALRRRVPTELIEAAKRVQAVNKKLVSFEQGFISKEGLPERKWFKHLAVAPGRWLGYGATPLPGVEEALTIEKNVTEAELQASRLKELIDVLAVQLAV